jgi:hypothetical protein
VAPARTRLICGVAAAAVVLTAPAGFAATKKKHHRHPHKRPKGPKPGTVLFHQSGSFQHGYPRLTQAAWSANNCGGTTLGPEETNNFSASIVDVSKWAGKHLDVSFTPDSWPVNASDYAVQFFGASCNAIDVNDGKTGTWTGEAGKTAQLGAVPTGAKWILLEADVNPTQYESTAMGVSWQFTVRVPQPTEKATPMSETTSPG